MMKGLELGVVFVLPEFDIRSFKIRALVALLAQVGQTNIVSRLNLLRVEDLYINTMIGNTMDE